MNVLTNKSDIGLLVAVRHASPLPQAAHVGVSRVQREAQTGQEAPEQQGSRALHVRHGPEGKGTDIHSHVHLHQKPAN